MTGRELILYILSNGLEDEPVFEDGKFIGYMTPGEAAAKLNVGIATIYVWIHQKQLDGVLISDVMYISIPSLTKLLAAKQEVEDNE